MKSVYIIENSRKSERSFEARIWNKVAKFQESFYMLAFAMPISLFDTFQGVVILLVNLLNE